MIDIHDELLARAKCHARDAGRRLRSVVEDGLRRVLSAADSGRRYKLSDPRDGDRRAADPLETYSWPKLREVIYGNPFETRSSPGR